VLPDHHLDRRPDLLEDFCAETQLFGPPELREIAPEQDEIGLRVER